MIAPLIAIVIFTILLTTILRGRFLERSSHALIVFMLWMYATSFYVEILKFYKDRKVLFISITGMFASLSLAVILTPLERYCDLLYSVVHEYIFLLGFFLLLTLYLAYLKSKQK